MFLQINLQKRKFADQTVSWLRSIDTYFGSSQFSLDSAFKITGYTSAYPCLNKQGDYLKILFIKIKVIIGWTRILKMDQCLKFTTSVRGWGGGGGGRGLGECVK